MLGACASFGASRSTEPDPVIETRVETQRVCPPELSLTPPERPEVPADAIVEANASGARWLAAELAWGGRLLALFTDAAGACPPDGH